MKRIYFFRSFQALLVFSLAFTLTNCGNIDNPLEELNGGGSVSAATITTAPTATTGDIIAGDATALVTAGSANGGTMMYQVTTTNTKPSSTDGFSDELPTAASLDPDSYFVWYYAKADATHSDSEIAATAIEVTVSASLSMPLTLKAFTAGTITVANAPVSMQFSLDGGTTKTAVSDVFGTIDVAEGDKVTFYGSTASYGDAGTYFGGNAQVKMYGNIMSLVSTDYADNKTLTAAKAFKALFNFYNKLIDASGLLLPATTLKPHCYMSLFDNCSNLTKAPKELPATDLTSAVYCYNGMFQGCSSLTTAPKLPATTLDENCYQDMFNGCTSLTTAPALPATDLTSAEFCYNGMFQGCSSLTTAYVKAAYVDSNGECTDMFNGCTAAGTKVLHSTSGNHSSWEGKLPSGWTHVGDWN